MTDSKQHRIHPFYIFLLLAGMAICIWYLWQMETRRMLDLSAAYTRAPARGPVRLQFLTPREGWGTDAEGHTLFHTEDGGRSWSVVRRFSKETLSDFQFFENNTGFALLNGSLYKTADGGQRWERIYLSPDDRAIERMLFFSARAGLFLDRSRTVWRTEDGGRNWQRENIEQLSDRSPRGLEEIERASAQPAPDAVGPEAAEVRQRVERATTLFAHGDYNAVLAVLAPIERPTAPVATLRGWAFYRQHDVVRAKQAFLQALALDPKSLPAQNGQAYCLYREYRYADAEKIFQQVLASAPEDVDALIGTGLIALYSGRYVEAEEIFQKVRRLDPNNKEIPEYLERARRSRESGG